MSPCLSCSPTVGACGASTHIREHSEDPAVFLSSPAYSSPGFLLDPGTRMERFTIIRHLGSGRGSHVYLAHDDVRAHEVALKVADLRPEMAPWIEARMRREIDLRRRIGTHPHVLTLFEPHRIRIGGLDLFVLSMEYADGGDFRQWLNQTQNDPEARVEQGITYVLQVANGVLAMHRAGVVHLDFKPENVFWVQGGWKIGDLDHARAVEDFSDDQQATAKPDAAEAAGTPGYTSPEACEPGRVPIDGRADIYGLGVILRETLRPAGYLPSGGSHAERSATRWTVARVIKRCLEVDPDDRFQLVEHAIDALEATIGRGAAPGKTWLRQDGRWRKARRCLAKGRVHDARRLCKILLDACAYHPGAQAVLTELDRREAQALTTIGQLAANAHELPLDQALGHLRKTIHLLADHEKVARLFDSLEQRLTECRSALVDGLTCLSAGNLSRFAELLDQASTYDPGHVATVEACVRARDMVLRFQHARSRIAKVTADRDYGHALQLTRRYRHRLAKVIREGGYILGKLESEQDIPSCPSPQTSRKEHAPQSGRNRP